MKSILIIVSISLLSACVSIPVEKAVDQKYADEIRNAVVYVIVPQDRLVAATFVPQVNMGGIIPGLLNELEASNANQAMINSLGPLYKVTKSLNFREDFLNSLKASKIFFSSKNIKLITEKPAYHEDRLKLVRKAQGRPVVILDISYTLDITYRTLLINSEANLYTKLSEYEVKIFDSSYQSSPIHYDYSFYSSLTAQKLWPENNAAKYKKYYKEGIKDTISMLKTAIIKRPSNLFKPGDIVSDFYDTTTNAMRMIKAKKLSARKNRSIVLSEDGTYYSKPTGPTFKSSNIRKSKKSSQLARVYFYRTAGDDYAPIQPDILVSNKKVGKYIYGTYSYADLKPGLHTIKLVFTDDVPGSSVAQSQISDIKPISLNIQKNKEYFVRFFGYKGLFTDDDALKEVSSDIAISEISSLFSNHD